MLDRDYVLCRIRQDRAYIAAVEADRDRLHPGPQGDRARFRMAYALQAARESLTRYENMLATLPEVA